MKTEPMTGRELYELYQNASLQADNCETDAWENICDRAAWERLAELLNERATR